MFDTVKAFNSETGSDFKNRIKLSNVNTAMQCNAFKGQLVIWIISKFYGFSTARLAPDKAPDKAPVLCKSVKTTL